MPIWGGRGQWGVCWGLGGRKGRKEDWGEVERRRRTYSYTAFWRQVAELAHHHSAAEVRIHLRGYV